MIEGSTDDGDYLVQVSAQVMTRDESTGGWVPLGGGGLSKVRLCKLTPLESPVPACGDPQSKEELDQLSPDGYNGGSRIKPEYVIQGERIADHTIILDCRLKKDIEYTKANPKWHHWKTDDKRYGLTFERSEDAKAFDQGIRIAVADLREGMNDTLAPIDSEEGVFAYMELPFLRKDSSSHSASTTSTTTSSPGTNSPQSPPLNNDPFSFTAHHHGHPIQQPSPGGPHPHHHHPHNHFHRVHYINSQCSSVQRQVAVAGVHSNGGSVVLPLPQQQPVVQYQQPGSPVSEKVGSPHKSSYDSSSGGDEVWVRPEPSSVCGKSDMGLLDCGDDGESPRDLYKEESYVVFNKNKAGAPHEYSYPNLEPAQKPPAQRSSTKKAPSCSGHPPSQPYPPLPLKNKPKSKGEPGKVPGQSGVHDRLMSPQVQCKNCLELFSINDNPRGSCEDSPDDSVARCIECISCVYCTSCLMYHCWADADGEFRHPCSCDPGDPNHCERWTALTFLSFLFPCLWCYPPLKACHHCGTLCGLCGGRHKAA